MINAEVIQLTMLRTKGSRDASDLCVYQLVSLHWRHLLKFQVSNIKEHSIMSALHLKSTGSPTVELAPPELTDFFF